MAETVLFPRFTASSVLTALKDTPVVMVNGPRQCGKTTLVREMIRGRRRYLTLDEDTTLAAARYDPTGFLQGLDRVVIDEVQRVPDLLRVIKLSVDRDRRPGRFLLTGSANVLTLPRISESLAGRMAVVDLLPLSYAEIENRRPVFLEAAFSREVFLPGNRLTGDALVRVVLTGGYPEMLRRADVRRRQAWARDYVHAIVQRDMRDIADIEKLDFMPRLLRILAQHAGNLTNFTQIGGHLGLDDKTTRKYLGIFEQLFLVRRVEPWFGNQLKRLIKTPKLHFLDSGLLAALLGVNAGRIAKDRSSLGAILETFVYSEIAKQSSWLDAPCRIFHYRDKDQDEVDLVVENDAGEIIGVEVKAAASAGAADFKGLRKLARASGKAFCLGLVLYCGEEVVSFGEDMLAAPLDCLWSAEADRRRR